MREAHLRPAQRADRQDFREIYGSHTCDRRSPARVIQERFPMVKIEPGFTEEDELWLPDDRETDAHMQLRARRYMDRIFAGEAPETCKLRCTECPRARGGKKNG